MNTVSTGDLSILEKAEQVVQLYEKVQKLDKAISKEKDDLLKESLEVNRDCTIEDIEELFTPFCHYFDPNIQVVPLHYEYTLTDNTGGTYEH